MDKLKNSIILITGGTGSWGNELTKQLLAFEPKEIRIYSRGEINQVAMNRKFNDKRLKFIIGDVRDYNALKKATKRVNTLFHLAALKHVPICEEQPDEAIFTNVIGTQNIVKVAEENEIERTVDVSSDKAVAPNNLYGMTKGVGEKLILRPSQTNPDQQFMVVRGGNALGSNGSVVPFFIDLIKQGKDVPITHEEMTRYYITLSDAIGLVLKALQSKLSGDLFVMKMKACKVIDLAEVLIEHYNPKVKTKIIGIRPGEKIHEVLVSKNEARWTYQYNGKYYLIYPFKKLDLRPFELDEYASNTELMGQKEIKEMLQEGGFLK